MTYPDYVVKRFWAKTEVRDDLVFNGSPCILWTGAQNRRHTSTPYGRFCGVTAGGERIWWVAHRFAFVAIAGRALLPGLELDHLCRRTLCVNANHLEPVTQCENRRRAERHRIYSLTCPHGHLWTHENRRPNKNARGVSWCCAQCNRERVAAFYAGGVPIRKRTLADLSPTCKNNHPRTKQSTRFDKHGVAVCRLCQRDSRRRHAMRQKKIQGSVGSPDLLDL